jgi:hypothetical protein
MQGKNRGPNQQYVIEEEGNYSQRSSDDESYSVGRSVGGTSGAKHVVGSKNMKQAQQQMMIRNKQKSRL